MQKPSSALSDSLPQQFVKANHGQLGYDYYDDYYDDYYYHYCMITYNNYVNTTLIINASSASALGARRGPARE